MLIAVNEVTLPRVSLVCPSHFLVSIYFITLSLSLPPSRPLWIVLYFARLCHAHLCNSLLFVPSLRPSRIRFDWCRTFLEISSCNVSADLSGCSD